MTTAQTAQHTARIDGFGPHEYREAAAALAGVFAGPGGFGALPMVEQLAVLADFLPMLADQRAPAEIARSYARNIGPGNLRAYAACMVINLRRALGAVDVEGR